MKGSFISFASLIFSIASVDAFAPRNALTTKSSMITRIMSTQATSSVTPTSTPEEESPIDFDNLSAESAQEAAINAKEASIPVIERKAPRQASWFPMLLSPLALDGTYAGDVGFDPLGFSTDKVKLKFFREAEIKHARLAMLGVIGWPASELWHKELANIFGLESILASSDRAPSILNGGLSNVWIEAAFGIAIVIGGLLELKNFDGSNREAGDNGFDPLRLHAFRGSLGFDIVGQVVSKEAKLAAAKKDMELCEIKNGRTAMLGITGMVLQELISGIPVVQQTPFFFGDPIL